MSSEKKHESGAEKQKLKHEELKREVRCLN
jgi:hypothetical protein